MKKLSIFVVLLLIPALGQAAEFFCASGNVTCLIAAIGEANNLPGKHTISLEPGTYTLTAVNNDTDDPNGLPSIRGTIEIRQNDQGATIERDPGAPPFRLFHVAPTGDLKLYGLGLRNGDNSADIGHGGGAVYNRGSISLEQLAIYQNQSFARDNFGGAIRNDGRAVLVDTELYSNFGEFHQAPFGGAIGNHGELTITRGVIRRNNGFSQGGISSDGQLRMVDSAVLENIGGFFSGGLYLSGTATIINTTIARNNGHFVSTFGGGITVFRGFLKIINSTIVENIADRGGAGIHNEGGTVEIQNTILALNTNGPPLQEVDTPNDCDGPITSLGNNIIGTLANCAFSSKATDFLGDPRLQFADTHYPPLADSPAIDSANTQACPLADQLGLLREGKCDIGAVEFEGRSGLVVAIDIRPKSDADKINPKSAKAISVAILSITGFDATTIDSNSVRFGAKGNEAAPVHVAKRDVDGDGTRDLVVRFHIQDLGIKCGDTSAVLTGQVTGGQSLIGSSPIQTVQCKTVAAR